MYGRIIGGCSNRMKEQVFLHSTACSSPRYRTIKGTLRGPFDENRSYSGPRSRSAYATTPIQHASWRGGGLAARGIANSAFCDELRGLGSKHNRNRTRGAQETLSDGGSAVGRSRESSWGVAT